MRRSKMSPSPHWASSERRRMMSQQGNFRIASPSHHTSRLPSPSSWGRSSPPDDRSFCPARALNQFRGSKTGYYGMETHAVGSPPVGSRLTLEQVDRGYRSCGVACGASEDRKGHMTSIEHVASARSDTPPATFDEVMNKASQEAQEDRIKLLPNLLKIPAEDYQAFANTYPCVKDHELSPVSIDWRTAMRSHVRSVRRKFERARDRLKSEWSTRKGLAKFFSKRESDDATDRSFQPRLEMPARDSLPNPRTDVKALPSRSMSSGGWGEPLSPSGGPQRSFRALSPLPEKVIFQRPTQAFFPSSEGSVCGGLRSRPRYYGGSFHQAPPSIPTSAPPSIPTRAPPEVPNDPRVQECAAALSPSSIDHDGPTSRFERKVPNFSRPIRRGSVGNTSRGVAERPPLLSSTFSPISIPADTSPMSPPSGRSHSSRSNSCAAPPTGLGMNSGSKTGRPPLSVRTDFRPSRSHQVDEMSSGASTARSSLKDRSDTSGVSTAFLPLDPARSSEAPTRNKLRKRPRSPCSVGSRTSQPEAEADLNRRATGTSVASSTSAKSGKLLSIFGLKGRGGRASPISHGGIFEGTAQSTGKTGFFSRFHGRRDSTKSVGSVSTAHLSVFSDPGSPSTEASSVRSARSVHAATQLSAEVRPAIRRKRLERPPPPAGVAIS